MYPIMPLETAAAMHLLTAMFAMFSAMLTWFYCGRA